MALSAIGPFRNKTQAKANLRRAFEAVASRLRNTTTICRKCHVHPEIVAWTLRDHFQRLNVGELDPVGRACPMRSAPCCACSSVGSLPGAGVERPKVGVMPPQLEQVVRRTSLIDGNLSEPLALEAAGD